MRRLRVLSARAALPLCLGALLLSGTPAYAHSALKDGSPGPGDSVAPGADVIGLAFAPLKAGTAPRLSLVGPDGTQVPVGKPVLADGSVVCAAVAAMPAGINTLSYTVTSADGDEQSSAFQFEVVQGAEAAAVPAACRKQTLPAPRSGAPREGAGAAADTASDGELLGLDRPVALTGLAALAVAAAGGAALAVLRRRRPATTAPEAERRTEDTS